MEKLAFAEIEAQLIQAEEVLYGLAAGIDAGDERALPRAAVAKLLITRSAISAVQTALAALGNPALTRSNPLERHSAISSAAASTRRRTTRR
jgi:alkylation response protein AidB-like acyl-CoA dehydrogenase